MKFYDLGITGPTVRAALDDAYRRVLDSGALILGREVEGFEVEFAAYCGAEQAIGVGNGLDALTLALRAAGIGLGDEVIVPSHTFAATWLAVCATGATIVPIEPDLDTYVIGLDAVAAAITPRTAAILPVSLYGHPVNIAPLRELADRHGLFLLEDAAQAHGADQAGMRTGSGAHATAFSFYPTKNLGALGDGGAVVTSDAALADRLRRLRNYGSTRKYVHDEIGVNSRLDELQAAFLRAMLPALDDRNARRRALAARYDAALVDIDGLVRPIAAPGARHVHHLYVVRVSDRDGVQARLARGGIETLVHYPIACHRQQAFASLGFAAHDFPIATRLADEVLSLPLWPDMPADAPEAVAAGLREAMVR